MPRGPGWLGRRGASPLLLRGRLLRLPALFLNAPNQKSKIKNQKSKMNTRRVAGTANSFAR
jgi:hypothetical protein